MSKLRVQTSHPQPQHSPSVGPTRDRGRATAYCLLRLLTWTRLDRPQSPPGLDDMAEVWRLSGESLSVEWREKLRLRL